jgi:predicted RNA-binding Zn-ribbon protein involved in translation (DUF1610 family)
MYICPECGSEIPADSDFCHYCGRKRDNTIRLDEKGNVIQTAENRCSSCGSEMSQGDIFCPNCGEPVSRTQMKAFRPKMIKYGWIGLALALIPGALGFLPGLFSIYGLGHFYFKKWTRGAVYIILSLAIFYSNYHGMDTTIWTRLIFVTISVFIYIMQAMEVLVLAYLPPKTPSDDQ